MGFGGDAVGARAGEERWLRAGQWYAALLFALYAALLLGHRAPAALGDFADWTYEGVLLKVHLLGGMDPAHVLKRYPVPNCAATVGIGLLALLLPWSLAAKLWICAQMAIWFAAMRHLLRTTGAAAAVWFVLPSAVFLNVNFWFGFENFQLGICWAMLMMSLLLRGERRVWVLGGLPVVAFFTHMIPFGFCVLLLLLWAWKRRRVELLWAVVPGALLSGWYVLGRFLLAGNADGRAGMASAVRSFSTEFWMYKVNSYLKSPGFANPVDSNGFAMVHVFGRSGFLLLLGLHLLLCAAILTGVIAAARRHRRDAGRNVVWVAIATFCVAYLLAPGTALGVSDPGSRLLQVALALAIALSAGDLWVMKAGAVCAVAGAVANTVLLATTGFGPANVSVATALPPGGRLARLAHVYNRSGWSYYPALDAGQMDLRVFPTGMFLSTAGAKEPPATGR